VSRLNKIHYQPGAWVAECVAHFPDRARPLKCLARRFGGHGSTGSLDETWARRSELEFRTFPGFGSVIPKPTMAISDAIGE